MEKRGRCLQIASSRSAQIAVFFFIGLIILTSLIILSTSYKEDTSKLDVGIEAVQIDDANLRSFIQFCVDTVAKDAVFYLGFVGGNLKNDAFPQFFFVDSFYKVPYYYYEGTSLILTEDGFKNLVLAKYMNDNIRKCTNNFRAFRNARIVDANAKTNVEMSDDEVIFNVRYPVSINRLFSSRNLEPNYIAVVKVRLKELIQIAQNIVQNEVRKDRHIHWDFMTDISSRNYNITAYTEHDNTIIYRIIDLENEMDKEPYIFQFANKIKLKRA